MYRVRKQQTELSCSLLDANKVEIGVGEYATAYLLPGKMRFGILTLGGRGHDPQMPAAILDARVDVRKELLCIAGDRRRPILPSAFRELALSDPCCPSRWVIQKCLHARRLYAGRAYFQTGMFSYHLNAAPSRRRLPTCCCRRRRCIGW